jgi:hypothetical protein
MRLMKLILAAALLPALTSCGQRPADEIHAPGAKARKGVTEVEPIESGRVVAGQTLYVPAYSSVFVSNQAQPLDLAITLSVRNTDRRAPIVVTAVEYYDHDGQLARKYLQKPVRIAPLAAMEYFVRERDTSGGYSASFLVEWTSDQSVSAPVVESVMVGTAGNRGVSFTCTARVIADRALAMVGDAEKR